MIYLMSRARAALSYWIRPYDMLADRRRWRWQPRTPCGSEAWVSAPAATQETLQRLVEAHESRITNHDERPS